MDAERVFRDHHDVIDKCIRAEARRRYLSTVERDDFAAFVCARLIEEDYALIRKFRNLSSMWTYLAMVIGHTFPDFRVTRWPDWRPSEIATRMGPIAELLERLIVRDQTMPGDAFARARTEHGVPLTDGQLLALWLKLKKSRNSRD